MILPQDQTSDSGISDRVQTAAVLQMENLKHSYGKTSALTGLDLEVLPGELVGLIGPDGAGKTTAMRILAGLIGPREGKALVCGHVPLGDQKVVRDLLGYMPQQYSLYGDLTIDENLKFFSRMFGLDKQDYQERRDRLLSITRLKPFVNRRADALSGGMYKKLALSCALLHRPKCLLLDEPTNGVDPVSRRELWELLLEFVGEGMAVLIATPYMDEAARCHRVGLIDEGRLLLQGEPERLLEDFEHLTFKVTGSHRDEVEGALNEIPEVLVMSPAGALIRIVLKKVGLEKAEKALEPLSAALVPCRPDFDDLFLVMTQEARE